MRFLFSLLTVGVGALFSLLPPCFAAPPVINWWNDPHVIQTLGLTPEQGRKIENIVQASLKKRETLSQQLAPLHSTIADQLSLPTLDVEKIQSALAAQLELRNARRREVVSMRIQVRQVLSTEQFKKLLELNPLIMRQRWIRPQILMEAQNKSPSQGKKAASQQDENDEDDENDGDLP